MTWVEIDLVKAEWVIPAERMKAKREHRVPLTPDAVGILKSLPQSGEMVFPAPKGGPLSDMTLAAVHKRMGIDATVHGWRRTFKDWTAERTSTPREISEAALAHQNKDRVEAAYLRTDHFEKRRALMDQWANFLRGESNVLSMVQPTGHGKSAVALTITFAVGAGEWLGSNEVKQGSVLFLAGENHDDIRERWIAMCEKTERNPTSLPVTFLAGFVDLKRSLPILREHFESYPLRLVVVDTLAAFFDGDNENDNAQLQAFTNDVLRPLTELPGRPTVLVPAHPTKGAGKDSLTPKGGSSLLNAIDGNLSAWNSDGTVRVHWQGKFRGAPWSPWHFELSEYVSDKLLDSKGNRMPTVTARAMLDSEIGKAVQQAEKIENQVLKLLSDGLTYRAIADEVVADGKCGISKSRVDRVVKSLKEQKWVCKTGRKWVPTSQGLAVLKQANEGNENDA